MTVIPEKKEKKKRIYPKRAPRPHVRKEDTPPWKKDAPWRTAARSPPKKHIPLLPSDKFSPWGELLPEVLTAQETDLLTNYLVLTHKGHRPSACSLRDSCRIGKGRVFRLWADLHMKGAVQLIDDDRSGWSHLAVHPSMWALLAIAPPSAPPPLPDLMVRHLFATGKTIYILCLKWFSIFCYWPEPRDLARPLHMTDDGVSSWLKQLADMGAIPRVSYRQSFKTRPPDDKT